MIREDPESEHQIFITAYENVLNDIEYKNYLKQINRLGHIISDRLGDDQKLFAEYENLVNLSEAIYAESVYSLGLKNGQKKR